MMNFSTIRFQNAPVRSLATAVPPAAPAVANAPASKAPVAAPKAPASAVGLAPGSSGPPAHAPADPNGPAPQAPGKPIVHADERLLGCTPLFRDGAVYDEFQINPSNVDFANKRFHLDDAFVSLVKSNPPNARLSVVYHNTEQGVAVDAYRAAASAGKKSVYALYSLVNPDFDPGQIYRNELPTALGNGKVFSTMLVSRRLAVPDSASQATKQLLTENGYVGRETVPVGKFGYSDAFKNYFGLKDDTGVQMYDPAGESFGQKFKIFYNLCKDSPEFMAYKVQDVLGQVGGAVTLGVITPALWTQGTAYGIASTITSIGNIGGPAVGILGESVLGSVVDNAVNTDRPVDNLKKLGVKTAFADTANTAAIMAMHPAIMSHIGMGHPGLVFTGLYAANTLVSGVAGVVEGKANMAIHDQLINKAPLKTDDYAKNYYEILSVENAIESAVYLGSYSAAVAAVSAFPHISLPLAAAGAAMWAGSSYIWPLYHQKPEVKTTVPGNGYIHDGDSYVFDSGWEVQFKGGDGQIVQDEPGKFSISMNDGELHLKNDLDGGVQEKHKRRLVDYLPKFLKPKALGEKEQWDLKNGDSELTVSRYGNKGYKVDQVADNEFVVHR
jgi:hypothetical protein